MRTLDDESIQFEAILKTWKAQSEIIIDEKDLNKYITTLMTEYEHDYRTVMFAMFCCMKATFNYAGAIYSGDVMGMQVQHLANLLMEEFFNLDPKKKYEVVEKE